tara:strand:+ start:2734 stop:2946 length:213 start_codon:yes stop_codon:yes gene_type:complete
MTKQNLYKNSYSVNVIKDEKGLNVTPTINKGLDNGFCSFGESVMIPNTLDKKYIGNTILRVLERAEELNQ